MSRKRSSPSPEVEGTPPTNKRRPNDEEEEEQEEDESEITSPLACSMNPAGRPPEAGIIKRVYLENFMCHRKMTVDLCGNVNFIHGQNGSGKSAILAAVQICLGAGARRTHRARNLKELVRKEAGEGCHGAKVRVTLLNGGEDGFQQNVYGDTITVERNISLRASGGGAPYKLLDSQGVCKSTSKKDLDAMLDQLNIQVENPVAVLDQEEAKKFLTGKAQDKYNFFAKATELERMDRSYANVVDNITELEENKKKVQDSLQSKVDTVRKLEKEWEQYQQLEKLQRKVLDCRVDYAWSFYTTVQKELASEEQKLETVYAKKQKREEELTQVETLTNGPDQEQEVLEERLEGLTAETGEAADLKRQLETELKRSMAPVKAKERDIKNIQREEKTALRNLQNAKRALQEERENILAAAGHSDEAKRAATLKEAEAEHDELADKIQHLKQATTMSLRKYEEMEPRVDAAKSEEDDVKKQMNGVVHKLKELESGGKDSLAMFGQSCTRVDRLVKQAQREGRWKGPVAGPIGAHLKIAPGKEKYAAITEAALGGRALDRYVVTNHHDRQIFQRIREQADCQSNECGIYQISNSPRYNVTPAPQGVETVATCLNIENDVIFNAMVDHLKIDTRAVCDSKESSERSLLIKDNRGRSSIRGGVIREVFFLPDGDRWMVQNGNLSLMSNSRQLKKTLGVDKTAAIAELKVEAEELKTVLGEAKAKHAALHKERKEAQKSWNHERNQMRKAETKLDDIVQKINQIRAEAEESANVTVDTTELEQDVSSAEQTVDALKEQIADREKELEELVPTVRDIKSRLTEVTARNEKVLADLAAAEKDLQEHMQAMTQREEKKKSTKQRLEKIQEVVTKQERNVAKLRKDRDEALHKARQFQYRRDAERKKQEEEDENEDTLTPPSTEEELTAEPTEEELEAIEPVETPKLPAYYQSRIERTKKKIEDEKERRRLTESDPQVAFEKYMRAQSDLDGNMKQIDAIDENVRLLSEDMNARRRKWRQFREHIVNMTRVTFNEILNRKGSAGDLDFSHKEGTLDLIVQKDSTQEATQTNDVKALSGGERSFTTLALLLALGERLETPFRVMDEFDVFLDPVARKIALDTLVEMAKEMSHRQFIFITPQDLSALKTDPKLKIHHMKNPDRNGRVGGPSQQTLDFTQSSE